MYENFSAPSTESLDSIFNRLQKIVSQLAILGENISQEDLNLKFLRISTASTQVSTANLSDDTVYAFLASQPNRSQLVYEDLEQIHEDDIEEIDLKWQLALLSMRTRIGPRNQDSRNRNQDSSRRTVNMEEISFKAMLAIDEAGFDWSYMADDEVPTNIAHMAFSDSESRQINRVSDTDKCRNGSGVSKTYNDVTPPLTGYLPPPPRTLSCLTWYRGVPTPEFEGYGPKTSKNVSEDTSNEVRESPDALMVEKLVSDDKLEKKIVFPNVAKIEFVRPKQQEKPVRKPVKYAEMYRRKIDVVVRGASLCGGEVDVIIDRGRGEDIKYEGYRCEIKGEKLLQYPYTIANHEKP
ncbi:hypothetical protein Tco_0923302 [Tanacetum coccineum]|uniref:Uncharacterized protein n=1 Tax=Tanacetum coccineum TaxID=301880 RepID=A0ABQ5D317_9ASTR